MIGVRSGTNSSRGVRAVSWKRRRARVASGPRARGRGLGMGIAISAVDIWVAPFGSRGRGDRVAGAVLVQRDRHARADGESVFARHSLLAQRGEGGVHTAVDAKLD